MLFDEPQLYIITVLKSSVCCFAKQSMRVLPGGGELLRGSLIPSSQDKFTIEVLCIAVVLVVMREVPIGGSAYSGAELRCISPDNAP